MNILPAEDLFVRYSWLAEIAFYALAIFIALALWRPLTRRVARGGNAFWAGALGALGAPVTLIVAGIGLQQIIQTTADNIPYISFDSSPLRTLVIIAGIFWMLLRLAAAAEKMCDRPLSISGANIDRGAVHAAFRVSRYAIIIVAALTAMDSLGVSISGLLAFGGIGGAVVAFAAQKTLSNFFSGMIIFTERPFAAGDWIRCPGTEVEGVVETIGWRTTQLRTFDQRPLYVPNAMFSDNIIENPQRMTNRRIYETMGLRYADIGKMAAVLADVRALLGAHADIDQAQIQMARFDNYGASSLNFFIYAMTRTTKWREFHRIKEEILLEIAAIVEKHGAEFAFPTRTVHYFPAGETPENKTEK
ncbi:MAG: mechanosensitive ion channel family protein [Gammaproteobacteria bacterium]